MLELNDETFDKAAGDKSPLMVMFHAKWAGPCILAMPEFEAVASRRGNEIHFATFDVDDGTTIPARYNVRALPCFILFIDGKPVNMTAGHVGAEIIWEKCDDTAP